MCLVGSGVEFGDLWQVKVWNAKVSVDATPLVRVHSLTMPYISSTLVVLCKSCEYGDTVNQFSSEADRRVLKSSTRSSPGMGMLLISRRLKSLEEFLSILRN